MEPTKLSLLLAYGWMLSWECAGSSEPMSDADAAGMSTRPGDIPRRTGGDIRVISASERCRMQRYVDELVLPDTVVAYVTSRDGDPVACVDMHAQPALRHAGMEGHGIQLEPRDMPVMLDAAHAAVAISGEPVDHAVTTGPPLCPAGTVPMRRYTVDELSRFRTLDEFRRKIPDHIHAPESPKAVSTTALHQYAHAYRWVANWGAEAKLNLWNPYIERGDEFSLSQIWITRGSGQDLETVEAGWQVYPDLYGDSRARLFIYFTPDNYGSGGCYNLSCGAFVQVSNTVYIGGSFDQYSSKDGTQQYVTLLWYKDGTTGHWWLRHGDTWVGYYPRSLFDERGLRDLGAEIDFGGEIVDRRSHGRHTGTDMGSGYWPSLGFGRAAYQRSLAYIDTQNTYRPASGLSTFSTDRQCYGVDLRVSPGGWGNHLYFGGAGYSSVCR